VYTLSQGNNVTFSALKHTCPLKLDYALQFDGFTGYVYITIGGGVIPRHSSFSVTVWVKVEAPPRWFLPVVCTLQDKVCLYIEDKHLKGMVGEMQVLGGVISTDQWVHVSLVYNYTSPEGTLNIFVNGSPSKNAKPGNLKGSIHKLIIGRSGSGNNYNYFKGEMDEVYLSGGKTIRDC
jgi:hypothetical protein